MISFEQLLNEKIVVFDGAMGTNLQMQDLTPDDFGGEHLFGCNEHLILSKPSAVTAVHASFLEAGVDVIETNTFGTSSIVLAEYNLQDRAYELSKKGAELARKVAADFSTVARPRFVAGSVGPTTKLPSLGHISFADMERSFSEQIAGLVDGGADLLIIETCQDMLQIKTALGAAMKVFAERKKRLPIVASFTIETMGTMLMGTEVNAALTALEPYDLSVIGMNCATGPQEMSEHIRYLCGASRVPVSCIPNAGLPENVGGVAHYHLTPEELVHWLTHFVKDFGVGVVGGCCGTTPTHLKAVVDAVGGLAPLSRTIEPVPSVSSLYSSVAMEVNPAPVIVFERTNANGSKKFRDLLQQEQYDAMVAMAKEGVKEGAHVIDVCVAYVGRDEAKDMKEFVSRLNTQVPLPLMIDSTEAPVIETALMHAAGKCIVNSINLEDGEERLAKVLPLCRKYGAAVVALTIDEKGMAKTAQEKLAIARRIYGLAVEKYGMHPSDIIFDTLTFTLGSGDEEFRRAGAETLEAITLIRKEFPETGAILGISNISFGLSPQIRNDLNSVFLHYAIEAGLTQAIVNAQKIKPLFKIDEKGRELCEHLIFDRRRFDGDVCTYDPLTELIAHYSTKKTDVKTESSVRTGTIEEILKKRIIDGDRQGIDTDLSEAMKRYAPLQIINEILLDGMKVVGDLFGRGEMQLPFVLQSAETMKSAVSFLEPFMEKSEATNKGSIVLATVKGDVHDIGKNLVDIILTNNGYKVYNLGIKQPIENIIHSWQEHRADAIGMSGLLVKSTAVMRENLDELNQRGLMPPVVLGGAALTRRYVEQDLRALYQGAVVYAADAFSGLHFMEQLVTKGVESFATGPTSTETAAAEDDESLTGSEAKIAAAMKARASDTVRSKVSSDVSIPRPPFWGSRVAEDLSLDEIFRYINEAALIKGQWQVRKGKRRAEDYQRELEEKIYPELERLKTRAKAERLLMPKVVYGYFPCQSDGDDLIIYQEDMKSERLRFTFPRQRDDRFLCLSDYFAASSSGRMDVIALQMVSMGPRASEYAAELYAKNRYTDYLFFHGFGVESTEALAEYWHKKVREELGIAGGDAPEIKRLFSQGYQGSRYSFGYPACPNLEDHSKLFALLDPGRIGVTLSEEFMLEPEQSTDALIVHHPEARYFNVK